MKLVLATFDWHRASRTCSVRPSSAGIAARDTFVCRASKLRVRVVTVAPHQLIGLTAFRRKWPLVSRVDRRPGCMTTNAARARFRLGGLTPNNRLGMPCYG